VLPLDTSKRGVGAPVKYIITDVPLKTINLSKLAKK
jgi:hypothetical protein